MTRIHFSRRTRTALLRVCALPSRLFCARCRCASCSKQISLSMHDFEDRTRFPDIAGSVTLRLCRAVAKLFLCIEKPLVKCCKKFGEAILRSQSQWRDSTRAVRLMWHVILKHPCEYCPPSGMTMQTIESGCSMGRSTKPD
jgi:hypothetical protein